MGKEEKEKESKEKDGESDEIKYPYPKSVFFIISTEFCERFSYYGMKTVLSLFLKQVLGYNEDMATVLYHAFTALCYFTPILGAILADSFLGKYRTIFYVSIVYAIGQGILTVGAIGEQEIPGLPASALSFIGLFLIAVGTGGIKPCVASFGGEQFKLPEQQAYMGTYFSLFYAAINSGSLISTILTPILRQEVSCAGQESCYPAAFGVPAALMIVSILIFVSGRIFNFYTLLEPKENIIVKTSACIWHAFSQWWRLRKSEKHDSILDYAEDKYGKTFIEDVKALKSVTYMFLPFPIFWALFDQQGSRWTFQATRMNGDTFGWQILPDQMQVTNPILILAFIPIFDYGVYPLLDKLNLLKTPLKRIVFGCFLASMSFFVSGGLELILEKTYPILATEGNMNVTFYNGFAANCNMSGFQVTGPGLNQPLPIFFEPNHMNSMLPILDQQNYTIKGKDIMCGSEKFTIPDFEFEGKPPKVSTDESGKDLDKDDAMAVLFSLDLETPAAGLISKSDHREMISKSDTGFPFVKFIWNIESTKGNNNSQIQVKASDAEDDSDTQTITFIAATRGDTIATKIKQIGDCDIILFVDGAEVARNKTTFKVGGNYQFLVQYSKSDKAKYLETFVAHKITEENTVYIMWLLPQFVVMTAAEIMFSITSLQFSYTQAPESMKAVMMSVRFLTNAFGNILNVVVISLLKGVFSSQAHEFFLFASLMFLDAILLGLMAMSYQYVDYTTGAKRDYKDMDEKEKEKEKE